MNIIVDIDGTIADCRHRRHFVIDGQHDWKSFYESMVEDKPIEPIVTMINLLWSAGNTILLATGRPDQYKEHTNEWLDKHDIQRTRLRMRREHDYREDSIVKEEILKEYLTMYDRIDLVIDDRQPVVDMWRRNGIICLQNSMKELP